MRVDFPQTNTSPYLGIVSAIFRACTIVFRFHSFLVFFLFDVHSLIPKPYVTFNARFRSPYSRNEMKHNFFAAMSTCNRCHCTDVHTRSER